MGIWIRSQSQRSLTNCLIFNVGTYAGSVYIWGGVSDITKDTGIPLGTYPTESEAMAVLDMIEDFLKGPNCREIFTGEYPRAFQMPEAGFSEKEVD